MIMQAAQADQPDQADRECALELDAHPYRIQQIRRIVSAQLRYWRLDPLIDAASLGISELLGNVHRHARPDKHCSVRLSHSADSLTVAVADNDPRLPQLSPIEPLATAGRGLAVVEAVSDSWGTDLLPEETGKVVWFVLRTPLPTPTLVPLRTAVAFEPEPERIAVAASVPIAVPISVPAAVPVA